MIDFSMTGDTALVARLGALGNAIHARLAATMARLGVELEEIVEEKHSGPVLKRRSGRLAGAQNIRNSDTGAEITTAVGFNRATVPYGAYHEFGVPHSWLIAAKNAKALKFQIGGRTIFRRAVTHPPLPERSFLRSALAEFAPSARTQIAAAVAEETAP